MSKVPLYNYRLKEGRAWKPLRFAIRLTPGGSASGAPSAVSRLGFRVQSLGFGIWGLGFGDASRFGDASPNRPQTVSRFAFRVAV